MTDTAAHPDFRSLTRDEVQRALREPEAEPFAPIVDEVERLVLLYAQRVPPIDELLNRTDGRYVDAEPTCPIEEVAIQRVNDGLRRDLARSSKGA